MRFDLDDDQRALAAGVRELCTGMFAAPSALDTEGWNALREAGVFSLRIGESEGGLGLGMVEAAVVFEELGRALAPGPLIGTSLAAGVVDAATVGVVERDDGAVLVDHLDALDGLIVLDPDGVWSVDPSGVDAVEVVRPLDPLTPLHEVRLPAGEPVAGPEVAARWRLEGATLASALLLGIAGAVTERATAYAKQREQFGRPIGAFQAVKHLLADMVVRTEVARAAVHAAAAHLDGRGDGDTDRAVSVAKLLAGEHALANAKTCVQIHGGMGFTWEVPVHLYLKRAAVLAASFGAADAHAEAIAATL